MRPARPNNRPTAEETPNVYGKILDRWSTFERFQAAFQDLCNTVFGSGWAFLAIPPNDFSLVIVTTVDEEVPMSMSEGNSGAYPILGIDLWEHVSPFFGYQMTSLNSRRKTLRRSPAPQAPPWPV